MSEVVHAGLWFLLRGVVSAALLLAGASKAGRRRDFQRVIVSYGLLPRSWAHGMSTAVIAIEFVLGIMIWFDPLLELAAMSSAALFGIFAAAILENIIRGNTNHDCGCFGGSSAGQVNIIDAARSFALAGGAMILLLTSDAVAPSPMYSGLLGLALSSIAAVAFATGTALNDIRRRAKADSLHTGKATLP